MSSLTGAIDALPGNFAVAFGTAAEFYGSTSTLNSLATARSNLAASAVATYSNHVYVLKSSANALARLSSAEFDLSAALDDAVEA